MQRVERLASGASEVDWRQRGSRPRAVDVSALASDEERGGASGSQGLQLGPARYQSADDLCVAAVACSMQRGRFFWTGCAVQIDLHPGQRVHGRHVTTDYCLEQWRCSTAGRPAKPRLQRLTARETDWRGRQAGQAGLTRRGLHRIH